MPELANSTRRLYKATYVNVRPSPADVKAGAAGMIRRPFEKRNFLRELNLSPSETAYLVRTISASSMRDRAHPDKLARALRIMRSSRAKTPAALLEHLATVPASTLIQFGKFVAKNRRAWANESRTAISDVVQLYRGHLAGAATASAHDQLDAGAIAVAGAAELPQTPAEPLVAARETDAAVAWAYGMDVPPMAKLIELSRHAGDEAGQVPPRELLAQPRRLLELASTAEEVTAGFIELSKYSPVGRLHLEKIEMTPEGIEKGELVASIPLAPGETINVSHREWSTRTDEFELITEDALENFSETGVTEKNDLSQATNSEQKHETAFSLSGTLSYAGSSATIGYQTSAADTASQQESRQESIALTRKASSRMRQEHKQSFRVNSTVGRDDQSVRTIKNDRPAPIRIDYFQLIRKWRADLYRYGIRMTYDIVIPAPGLELMRKVQEIQEIQESIDEAFEFALLPSDITRENWQQTAADLGITLDEFPPPPTTRMVQDLALPYRDADEAARSGGFIEVIDVPVGPDFQIVDGSLRARYFEVQGRDTWRFGLMGTAAPDLSPDVRSFSCSLAHLAGRSGDVSIVLSYRWLSTGWVHYELELALLPEAYERWQFRTWTAMREGAEEAYFGRRQLLTERRDRLLDELTRWDALTLRRMEREEIMRGVLRWLFGPSFEMIPEDIEELLEGGPDGSIGPDVAQEQWLKVMEYGEMIKFLHHAIEWENVLYFTYPYFWDARARWGLKRFLRHPDALHREFLRSGAARVVLTIRPGFEVPFANFIESGVVLAGHPYLTIAEEIRNYASTNYPGIPAANPANAGDDATVEQRERGVRIGRWFEYTPTSALDVTIDTNIGSMA